MKPKVIQHRRKREGKTDYKLRLTTVKSGKPRMVIRRTGRNIVVQMIEYHADGDKVLATATTVELKKYGWKTHTKNMPAAYLVGLLCGTKAKKAKITAAIADIGLAKSSKGGLLYATVKGAVDSGLNIPHDKKILPTEDRISGKHIAEYAKLLSKDKAKYEKQFSKYIKTNTKPEEIHKQFEAAKANILKGKQ